MRFSILMIGLIIGLLGCIDHHQKTAEVSISTVPTDSLIIQYAKGFKVQYLDGCIKIISQSIIGNQHFADSIYILTSSVEMPSDLKIIDPNKLRIACQSSTYLAFLNTLGQLDLVSGICGVDYVINQNTRTILDKNEVIEICPSDQVDTEALFAANPTLFLTYPFGSSKETDQYSKKGIPTFLIAEYLEETQLARLEWIKLFGLLTGRLAEANAYFDEVETAYLNMREETPALNKTFIMNLPFQDEWYMPSSKSVGVELIEDAGLTYFYGTEDGTENKLHAKEEVWNDGIQADYWIIMAREKPGFTLADLCVQSPIYAEFKSVKLKQVIFCNTAEVDYFASGVVEPHVILKDFMYATEQVEEYEPQYFFRLE